MYTREELIERWRKEMSEDPALLGISAYPMVSSNGTVLLGAITADGKKYESFEAAVHHAIRLIVDEHYDRLEARVDYLRNRMKK